MTAAQQIFRAACRPDQNTALGRVIRSRLRTAE